MGAGRALVWIRRDGHRRWPAPRRDPRPASVHPPARWTGPDRRGVDWAATEAALGTALPGDYKDIVDAFGPGRFDEYLDLLVPGALGTDLVCWSQDMARYADLYRPYPVHPAPGGVLTWGISEQELTFHWLTGPEDPNDWPVLVQYLGGEWQRFDCGTGECVLRLLTDRTPPFAFPPSAGPFPHWFASSELPEH
ncbi:hypothetical protein ACFV0D_03115 [Streptomyces sp. NPDC059556]|uniref:hypothetical protein n=1 Tax=Streptomyces sp. NPDC059556 TaxID=3346863 RepID=UPI0036CC70C5